MEQNDTDPTDIRERADNPDLPRREPDAGAEVGADSGSRKAVRRADDWLATAVLECFKCGRKGAMKLFDSGARHYFACPNCGDRTEYIRKERG